MACNAPLFSRIFAFPQHAIILSSLHFNVAGVGKSCADYELMILSTLTLFFCFVLQITARCSNLPTRPETNYSTRFPSRCWVRVRVRVRVGVNADTDPNQLVCDDCMATEHPERCTHKMSEMPRWLSSKKMDVVRSLLADDPVMRLYFFILQTILLTFYINYRQCFYASQWVCRRTPPRRPFHRQTLPASSTGFTGMSNKIYFATSVRKIRTT